MPLYYLIVDCFIINKKAFLFSFFCVQNYSLKNMEEKFFSKNDTIKESANNNNKTRAKESENITKTYYSSN